MAYETSTTASTNGIVRLFTVASETCAITASTQPTINPEDTVNGAKNVNGRSVAFSANGGCLFFVTQNNIWAYEVTLCATSAKSAEAQKSAVNNSEASDHNKLLMYGAGAAAIGLFGWMLSR